MRKIPTIFERDWNGDRSRVLPLPHMDCAWVFVSEGWATRKLDGTCCMIRSGKLYKRREIKRGMPAPPGFELVNSDDETGKQIGWLPVHAEYHEDRWHREAWDHQIARDDGTYELIGPKVQGGTESDLWEAVDPRHMLISHNSPLLKLEGLVDRSFDSIKAYLTGTDIEGIVFHHEDGRMGKIKLKDFGLKRTGGLP